MTLTTVVPHPHLAVPFPNLLISPEPDSIRTHHHRTAADFAKATSAPHVAAITSPAATQGPDPIPSRPKPISLATPLTLAPRPHHRPHLLCISREHHLKSPPAPPSSKPTSTGPPSSQTHHDLLPASTMRTRASRPTRSPEIHHQTRNPLPFKTMTALHLHHPNPPPAPPPCRQPSFTHHQNLLPNPDLAEATCPLVYLSFISLFLYDIKPEFVESKFFSAAARKRGYIHNLSIKERFPLLPIPPKTIFEAFPSTKNWWPSWDTRTHLNCRQTCIASAKLTERIRSTLASAPDLLPQNIQKWIMFECRKWNLVWIGKNKVAPLELDEIEMLLGFPRNHTRGISRTERYKSLGNSFQIDTVAYHLLVLRDMFHNRITVLSLFSGIGGAEVALYRLGIRLKLVVSVELSDNNRNVVRSWWDQTNQQGTLIHISNVQQLNSDRLEQFLKTYNAFDLVIGGSPCNNLAGSNRHHRDGLKGEHSSLFYDYFRILDLVKCIMGQN